MLLSELSSNDIITVSLRRECIDDKGAKALSLNTALTSLDVPHNKISDKGAKALSLNTTLTSLDLRYNKVGDEGANSLSLNTSLTILDLRGNKIEDEGAKAFSLNTTLTSLDLFDNYIGNEGAKALSLNTTLTSLDLRFNNVRDGALFTLIQDRLTLNMQQLTQRRSQFLRVLIVLARDANNGASDSHWKRLPPDMRRYILRQTYEGWSLGMPLKAKERCGTFILNNVKTISGMIRAKVAWKIICGRNYMTFSLKI